MMTKMKNLLVFVLLLTAISTNTKANTYYSQGSLAPNLTTSWNAVRTGGGAVPANFTSGDIFVIQNGDTMITTAQWTISGTASRLAIESGGVLQANHDVVLDLNFSTLYIYDGGKYIHNNTSSFSSTIFNAYDVVLEPAMTTDGSVIEVWTSTTLAIPPGNGTGTNDFSNIIITNNSTLTAPNSSTILINDKLTITSGSTFNLTNSVLTDPGNGAGFNVAGTGTLRTTCPTTTSATPIPAGITWSCDVAYSRTTSAQTVVFGNYSNLNISGGNRTLSSAGPINISGTFVPGTNTITATNSVVGFNGVGAQSVPALSTSNYNHLTISNTGTKTLSANVTINGTLTLSSVNDSLAIGANTLTLNGSTALTGFLRGSTSSNLTVSGTTGGSPNIKFSAGATDSLLRNLTLNRTGSSPGITLASNIAITNLLTITNGTFNLNNRIVTLKSTSILNTAQLAPVGGAISYGASGSFTVERYIANAPHNNRAYRDLAPGVNTANNVYIFNTWQENGLSTAGYGLFITGVTGTSGVDPATGFDRTQTGLPSMYTYINEVWANIPNTNATKLNPYEGYRVLVRGDRMVNLFATPQTTIMNGPTVVRANGQVIYGTLTYTNAGVAATAGSNVASSYALSNNVNGFTLLGNPYPCMLDWSAISKTNISGTYWYYDPTIGTIGAYVTWDGVTNSNGASNLGRYIQPGQGFFVQTTAANPQLVIQESHKAATSGTLVGIYRTTDGGDVTVNKLPITLSRDVSGRGWTTMDGTVAVFADEYTNAVNEEDADKLENNAENLFIFHEKQISIEHRHIPTANDTIFLRLTQITSGANYRLTVNTANFVQGTVEPYLYDKYLNTVRLLKAADTSIISFTATADTNTYKNRFRIVFRASSTLPMENVIAKAYSKDKGIQVDWNTTFEDDIKAYEVEKSTNGTQYNKSFGVTASHLLNPSYQWFDNSPVQGTNYYRIKIIGNNNSVKYTKVMAVNLGKGQQINVYPVPVKGNSINIQLNNIDKGTYQARLYNTAGQVVATKNIQYNGGSLTETITWQQQLAKGIYTIRIANEGGNIFTESVVVE